MSRLESRCRLLLHAYPERYRTERGAEILATLLYAAPAGRSWPPAREAWSLVTGGLRVRAAENRQLSLVTNLRLTALLAAAIWLGQSAASYEESAYVQVMTHQWLAAALCALCAVTACLAIDSAWFGRRRDTAALALAVLGILVLAYGQGGPPIGANTIVPPLALAALAIGKERPPPIWLSIPAAVVIVQIPGLLPYPSIWWWPLALVTLSPTVVLGGLGITALWSVVDARPMIAFCMFLEVICVIDTVHLMPGAMTPGQAVVVALPAVLAGASLVLRRRSRARI